MLPVRSIIKLVKKRKTVSKPQSLQADFWKLLYYKLQQSIIFLWTYIKVSQVFRTLQSLHGIKLEKYTFVKLGKKQVIVELVGLQNFFNPFRTKANWQWCSRDRNLRDRDRDLAQIWRRDRHRNFVINAETETWKFQTETWKFETETRDLTFL